MQEVSFFYYGVMKRHTPSGPPGGVQSPLEESVRLPHHQTHDIQPSRISNGRQIELLEMLNKAQEEVARHGKMLIEQQEEAMQQRKRLEEQHKTRTDQLQKLIDQQTLKASQEFEELEQRHLDQVTELTKLIKLTKQDCISKLQIREQGHKSMVKQLQKMLDEAINQASQQRQQYQHTVSELMIQLLAQKTQHQKEKLQMTKNVNELEDENAGLKQEVHQLQSLIESASRLFQQRTSPSSELSLTHPRSHRTSQVARQTETAQRAVRPAASNRFILNKFKSPIDR